MLELFFAFQVTEYDRSSEKEGRRKSTQGHTYAPKVLCLYIRVVVVGISILRASFCGNLIVGRIGGGRKTLPKIFGGFSVSFALDGGDV